MPSDFRRFLPLASLLAVLTFVLVVLGATVRAMGAGLACPDWPLCHGALIPPLEGGVFYEWLHRAVALAVSLLFLVTLGWIVRVQALRSRLGPLAGVALGLLGVQVVLGGLTVLKLLEAWTVTLHLVTGSSLLAIFVLLALRARAEATLTQARRDQPRGLRGLAMATLAAIAGQLVLGGLVASHYAALACPDWPTCHGAWFPPLVGAVGLHMLHRYGAYLLLILALACGVLGRKSPDAGVRRAALGVAALALLQATLGVLNVLLHIPPALTAAHNAGGEALLVVALMLNFALFAVPRASRFDYRREVMTA